MRRGAAAALVVIAVVALAAPAGAKGITGGSIEGEGVDGVAVPPEMSSDTGVFELVWDASASNRLDAPPTADLGPRYVITWQLMGPSGDVPIEQSVYPYADGGPLTHVEPGQALWMSGRTLGGWLRAPARLTAALEALGAWPRSATSGGSDWAPIGGSLAAMVVLVAALAVVGSRRRGEVAPAAG